MKQLVVAFVALGLLAACNPNAETTNPAVATDEAVTEREAAAPAAGASSFTEEQARARITEKGFTAPATLTQAADGAWSGQTTKDGQTLTVTVDYQGNVISAQGTSP